MKGKIKCIGMIAALALIGLSMSGCPADSSSVSSGGITGTWRANMQGVIATIVITATYWTYSSPLGTGHGTYVMDGITARLFEGGVQIGTAVILDANTISVSLVGYGTFTFHRV